MKSPFLSALKTGVAPLVLGLAMISAPSFAQDAAADEADDEVIVVTGSRIASPEATAASPLQMVSREEIQNSGTANIQDLLLENPAMGTPTYARTNTAFATAGAGVATVDLRNLEIDRTLVLVNGRRFVAGIPGSSAVDLNVIPTQFLERVEILTGGTSAVYGSDAVAGVVNMIYRKNFEGIELNGQAGISTHGDGKDWQLNGLYGKNFADGRGNVMIHAGYSKQGTVLKRDRSTEAGSSAIDSTSDDLSPNLRVAPFFSGYTPGGRYFTDNTVFAYDGTSGALRPCFFQNAAGSCNGVTVGPDGFNRSAFRYLAVPVERYLGAIRANYEVSPALNFFFEGNYARTQASTEIEPFPMDTTDLYDNGQMPIESLVGGILYRNPYVPDAIFNDTSDTDGDGLRDVFITKRLTDFGGRNSTAKRDTFRIAAGFNGEVFSGFKYEVYGIYGQTVEHQRGNGQFNKLNFVNALNSIRDVNDINGNNNRTEVICANAAARAAGCIPANIFGLGTLTPAVGYLAAASTLDTKVTQTVFGANITGETFSLGLGADPISIAVGTEYRKETSDNIWDPLTEQGLNGGNALPSTRGKFDLIEGYGEVLVPILADKPFFHRFTLRGAVRVSHYSTSGTTFSYNYGGEWSPVQDVKFRVMQARSVRAPNVSELFDAPQQDFPSGLIDPCTGVTAGTAGVLGTNCRAAPGVNANIAANGAFAVSQADLQGITSFAGGNPGLKVEKGTSFTAGVVINPKSLGLNNLTLTVDYFNISIADAIVDTPLQFILDQCYRQSNAALCNFVVRRPAVSGPNNAGSLDEVNSGPSNSGGLKTSGIDAKLAWRGDFGDVKTNVSVSYTHLFSGYTIPLPGSDRDEFANEIGASTDRFSANLGLAYRNLSLNLTGTYIGAADLDDQLTGVKPGTNPFHRVPAEFYLDAQIKYDLNDRFELYFGADNILNNLPPYLADIGVGESAGQDTDTGTYDALGRRFYGGVRIKF